jgi:hypothetical protein
MKDVIAPEKPSIATFTELNVRQDKGKPHFIRLHDSVVKGLERRLTDNPSSQGILLGSIEDTESCTIAVEQFEPTTKVDDLVRARKSVVGYYRSHSRDGFALDAADRALFERCFPKGSRLALLVRPLTGDVGTAMFFLGQDGTLVADRATVEFPFNLHELGAEDIAPPLPAAIKPARGGLLSKLAVAGVVVIASVFGLSEWRVFERTGEQPQPKKVALDQPRVAEAVVSAPVVKQSQSAQPPKREIPKPVSAAPMRLRASAPPLPAPPAAPPEPVATQPLEVADQVPTLQVPVPSSLVIPKPVAASMPYTPPTATRQFAPIVPENVLRRIGTEVVVHVRVNVDAAGKIIGIAPVEAGDAVASALAASAVSSIKKWQFEPAHRGSEKVPGEIVLSFTFRK